MSVVKAFNEDVQKFLHDARNGSLNVEQEYAEQQKLYAKYADSYAQVRSDGEFQGPKRLSEVVSDLLGERKEAKILDYGCGIGPIADILVGRYGFQWVDGADPCKELLDVAKCRNEMKNVFNIGSRDDHTVLGSQTYDLVCSLSKQIFEGYRKSTPQEKGKNHLWCNS